MQHFFSPSPAIEKKFAESAFFHTKIKNFSHETVEFTSQWWAKHQKLLLGNNAPGKCLQAHMQHFFSPSPAIEKKFAESAFFHTKIKNLSWNRWIYEPMGAKHQKLLLGNNAPASAFTPTCNISSALAPLSRKNSLSQHFFIQKSKTSSWNRWIYEPMGAKHQKLLLGNNALASAFTPTCNISSALAPLSRKNSLSQHFFIQKSKTCHETVEFTSQWWQNTKNYSWATMPLASAFTPTCNISSALAPLSRKNSLSQHFFIQKSKTCHETVEFTSQWGQNTKNYSWATMPLASAFRPTCNISSALAPLSRKNSLSQHFFIQKSKTSFFMKTVEFTSQT